MMRMVITQKDVKMNDRRDFMKKGIAAVLLPQLLQGEKNKHLPKNYYSKVFKVLPHVEFVDGELGLEKLIKCAEVWNRTHRIRDIKRLLLSDEVKLAVRRLDYESG